MPYFSLPKRILSLIYNNYDDFMIFETTKFNKNNFYSYVFTNPYKTILTYEINKAEYILKKIDYCLENNYFLAGFFSYEFGYGLDYLGEKKFILKKIKFPIAYFNIYKDVTIFNHKTGKFVRNNLLLSNKRNISSNFFKIENLQLNTSFNEYSEDIKKIKKYIISGDTYQVNYTIKYKFDFYGSDLILYNELKKQQQVEYCSFIKNKFFSILSFSPELFFRIKNNKIIVKPMKGTIAYDYKKNNFKLKKKMLFENVKNRSENLMIVDLLRNDLGKISKTGTVKLKKIFQIERYKTLLQMTSTIQAYLKDKINTLKLLNSLFPSGSVTGAPKIRTMEIIYELEKEPRNIYTGAIGFFIPKKYSVFNVAIRTILIQKNKGELGIGSGIVYDSDVKKEFEECKLKARFFTKLAE